MMTILAAAAGFAADLTFGDPRWLPHPVVGMGRAEAKKLVETLGGKVASAISAKTHFLVTGEGGGSKRAKAAELGITVLDEPDFLALADLPLGFDDSGKHGG